MYGVLATCGLGCGANCSAAKIRRNRREILTQRRRDAECAEGYERPA